MYAVTIPYQDNSQPAVWARAHCASYITVDLHRDPDGTWDLDSLDYWFGQQQDAVMFGLRWLG